MGIREKPLWERRYTRNLVITDFLVVVAVTVIAQIFRYGAAADQFNLPDPELRNLALRYTALTLTIIVGWLVMLQLFESRDPKTIGTGPVEYKRVITATLTTFGLYAIAAFVMQWPIGRGYLTIALPAGLTLLVLSRWIWRKLLHRQRSRGQSSRRTLIVGERAQAVHVCRQLQSDTSAGFQVVGAVTSPESSETTIAGVPIVSDFAGITQAVTGFRSDVVVMVGTDHISPERLREIGWELEALRVDLIVATALTDVAGPRIRTTPVSGLPLIHVEYPQFALRDRVLKRSFDLIGATTLLVLTSPLFLAVAILVKSTSPGPVLYKQERIGRAGKPFTMFKFRSMVDGADDQLRSLLDRQGTADRPLHKVASDTRVTSVGRFIRRYSLDELPQLGNVIIGTMSLVGPRPQREAEVALYGQHDSRRLLVKPGITGLWQVSGRSSLDWEDAIRLDLSYVENWSVTGDLVLLWKTLRAAIRSDGAW